MIQTRSIQTSHLKGMYTDGKECDTEYIDILKNTVNKSKLYFNWFITNKRKNNLIFRVIYIRFGRKTKTRTVDIFLGDIFQIQINNPYIKSYQQNTVVEHEDLSET